MTKLQKSLTKIFTIIALGATINSCATNDNSGLADHKMEPKARNANVGFPEEYRTARRNETAEKLEAMLIKDKGLILHESDSPEAEALRNKIKFGPNG